MKILAVLALFLAYLCPAHADTWVINASTAPCDISNPFFNPAQCSATANINAIFTTQQETGIFFFSVGAVQSILSTEPVVIGISGTFNGMPMSFVQPPSNPNGIEGWLFDGIPQTGEADPQSIYFSAGGNQYELDWDGQLPTIFGAPIPPTYLTWSAVDPSEVPEPMTLWLLTVPLLLALSRWAQMSLRKLSRRI